MAYQSTKNWKDLVEGPKHQTWSRRDFIRRGLFTGAMSVALPRLFGAELIKSAQAGTLACPTPSRNPGAIAQIYASGGPTMGARFFSEAQAAAMNAATATNYGISGTNLLKLGPGVIIDSTSVFGKTLLLGPPGFPGGSTGWQTTVLKNICAGGHLGPFNADDGAGLDGGFLGSVSLDKVSQIGKDIFFNQVHVKAPWTSGTPTTYVSPSAAEIFAVGVNPNTVIPTVAELEAPFQLIPAASGFTSAAEMTNAANGAVSISQALSSVLGNASRKGASNILSSAGCAFLGNAALADPTFAPMLLDPANIAALNSKMTTASMSPGEQAQLSAFYNSALGVAGGVIISYNGRDYHGTDVATNVTPIDVEDARTFVMFLAGCYAAQQSGAMIYVSNGQAIANGIQAVTVTINGSSVSMNAPVALGDAGGAYNAGLVLFYSPTGKLPTPIYTGSLVGASGSVRTDPKISTAADAFAGLYLSAHQFVSGKLPQPLIDRMKAFNIAVVPKNVMVI